MRSNAAAKAGSVFSPARRWRMTAARRLSPPRASSRRSTSKWRQPGWSTTGAAAPKISKGQPCAPNEAITGRPAPAPEVPWFWSDQYDVKLQIAGLPFDADRQVVRGDPKDGRFAVFHLTGDRIVCVEAVNAPPEFMAGRLLIGRATPIDPGKLADLSVSMKEVAA